MKTFEKIVSKEKFEKGFHVTIKNLDNDEVIVDFDSRAIIGAFNNSNNDDEIRGIVLTACKAQMLMNTIEAADNCVCEIKDHFIEDMSKKVLHDLLCGGKKSE